MDLTFVDLATAPAYFIFPLSAQIKRLFEIKTLQEFLGDEGSSLTWKFECLLYDLFRFRVHAMIVAEIDRVGNPP